MKHSKLSIARGGERHRFPFSDTQGPESGPCAHGGLGQVDRIDSTYLGDG